VGLHLDQQLELFEITLDELERDLDLVNQVLEVTLAGAEDSDIIVRRYSFPAV
jgi:hypothetical protein